MKVLLFLFAFLFTSNALAQVNVEALRKDIRDKTFSGVLQLSMDGRAGNRQAIVVNGACLISLSTGPNIAFIAGSGEYGKFDGSVEQQEYFLHIRDNYHLTGPFYTDLFGQYENDKFRELHQRIIGGLGIRLQHDFSKWFRLVGGTSYMYEDNVVENRKGSLHFHRWNNYGVILFTISDTTKIGNTTYYQPVFNNFGNYRVYNSSSIEVKVNDSIELKISGTYRYESIPPGLVGTEDFRLKNAFVWKF